MFSPKFLEERKIALLKKMSSHARELKIHLENIKRATGTLREPGDIADASFAENCLAVSTFDLSGYNRTISDIIAALKHLNTKDGQYGICINCKSELLKKRLVAIPWAQRCIACQEEFEAQARGEELRKRDEEAFNSAVIAVIIEP